MLSGGRLSGIESQADHVSREERVRNFEFGVAQLSASPLISESDCFVVAYLLAQVSPGTLDHIQLLSPISKKMPQAYFWYGLLAGLAGDSKIFGVADGLGRRLIRDITRSENPLDRPAVDIDWVEVLVAGESVRSDELFRGTYPGFVTVGLKPGVAMVVKSRETEKGPLVEEAGRELVRKHLRLIDRAILDLQVASGEISKGLGLGAHKDGAQGRVIKRK